MKGLTGTAVQLWRRWIGKVISIRLDKAKSRIGDNVALRNRRLKLIHGPG
jgi:hypothetical protein